MAWRDMAGPLTLSQQPTLGEGLIDVEVPPVRESQAPSLQAVPTPQVPIIEISLQPLAERIEQLTAEVVGLRADLASRTLGARLARAWRWFWTRLRQE